MVYTSRYNGLAITTDLNEIPNHSLVREFKSYEEAKKEIDARALDKTGFDIKHSN